MSDVTLPLDVTSPSTSFSDGFKLRMTQEIVEEMMTSSPSEMTSPALAQVLDVAYSCVDGLKEEEVNEMLECSEKKPTE